MLVRLGHRAACGGDDHIPELQAYLRGAQLVDHDAHVIRGTSIKPVRSPEYPDIHLF